LITRKSPRIGLLLAPLAVPLAFTALVVLSRDDPSYKDGLMHADSAWPWVLVLGAVTLFGYVASVLLGVPLIWQALAILAGAGALVGILVSASYCWLAGISGRVPDSPRGQRS